MRVFFDILALVALGSSVCADFKFWRGVAYAQFDERKVQLGWFRPGNDKILAGIVLTQGRRMDRWQSGGL